MSDNISSVILTDISFVFFPALECDKNWYSLILNAESIYQFGRKIFAIIVVVAFDKGVVEKPNFTVSSSPCYISAVYILNCYQERKAIYEFASVHKRNVQGC